MYCDESQLAKPVLKQIYDILEPLQFAKEWGWAVYKAFQVGQYEWSSQVWHNQLPMSH